MGFIFLPLFLIIVLVRQLVQLDLEMSILISIGLIVSLISRSFFLKGNFRVSVMIVSFFFTLLLTAVCSFGNGIHDIGLIGFPIIIGFSSIILDQKQLIIASVLSVLGLSWLVVGAQFNFFEPIPVPPGNTGDFIIAALLIVLGGFVAFSLTRNMKNSLRHVQREISISKKDANHLAKEIYKKEEIISEIHKAAINSLSHIQQLIAHKQIDKASSSSNIHNSLKRKILVMEIAHNILLKERAPIFLDIMELARKVLDSYEKNLQIKVLQIEISQKRCTTSLDQAINFGICLLELVSELDDEKIVLLKIRLYAEENRVTLKLAGFEDLKHGELGIVMNLLTKQLKGELKKKPSEVILTFTTKSVE